MPNHSLRLRQLIRFRKPCLDERTRGVVESQEGRSPTMPQSALIVVQWSKVPLAVIKT